MKGSKLLLKKKEALFFARKSLSLHGPHSSLQASRCADTLAGALLQAFTVPVITIFQCQTQMLKTSATSSFLPVLSSDWDLLSARECVSCTAAARNVGRDGCDMLGTAIKQSQCVCAPALLPAD